MAQHVIDEAREALEATQPEKYFGVWPENWHAVSVFVTMASQWRWVVGDKALRTGLEYASLPVVMAAVRPTVPAEHRKPLHELLPQIAECEGAVLGAQA